MLICLLNPDSAGLMDICEIFGMLYICINVLFIHKALLMIFINIFNLTLCMSSAIVSARFVRRCLAAGFLWRNPTEFFINERGES